MRPQLLLATLIIAAAVYLMVRRSRSAWSCWARGSSWCFGAGIAAMGVSEALINVAKASGSLTLLAGAFPWALNVLSGSGSGPILTFAQTFLAQMVGDADVVTLAAMACFGGAFGRTASPVAAVVVYSVALVGVSPVLLVRRFLPALAAGAAVAFSLPLR